MSFRFSLQSVLEIKIKELEQAELEEARIRTEIQATERRIALLRDAYVAEREQLNQLRLSADFAEARLVDLSLEDKKDRIMELLRSMARLKDALAFVARMTLQLRKKIGGMERLRAKRSAEYELRMETRLQSEIDARSALQVWQRKREREIA